MDQTYEPLPEGTDRVIGGAGFDAETDVADAASYETESAFATKAPEPAVVATELPSVAELGSRLRAKLDEKGTDLKAHANDTARMYAVQGKDKATATLDDFVKLVDHAADTIDEKVGSQYGDYARKASATIAGFADSLRDKDVDALFNDARTIVGKSPAIAAGVAAAVGFAVARIVKAGADAAPTAPAPHSIDSDPVDRA